MKDYYKILNVSKNSTMKEIRDAYLFLIMKNHPDNNYGDEKYKEISQDINEAYSILYNENKRKKYDEYYKIQSEKRITKKPDLNRLTSTNFILEDGTVVSPQKITQALNTLLIETKKKEQDKITENRKIYLEAFYRSKLSHNNKYTNQKPRQQQTKETDEEYQIYIDEYYNPTKENAIEYIPNTDIARPRYMKSDETNEHYKKYLETYYSIVFPHVEKNLKQTKVIDSFDYVNHDDEFNYMNDYNKNKSSKQQEEIVTPKNKQEENKSNIETIPIVVKEPKENHSVIKRTKTKLKKAVKAALFAGALILTTMGIKSMLNNNSKEDNSKEEPNIEQEYETPGLKNDDPIINQIDEMLNEKEQSIPTIGDIVNMKEGKEFFYTSLGANPSGTVGNMYTEPGNYIVDAIAIVDENNNLAAVSYDGGISSQKLAEQYNIDLNSGNYKINYHFSDNNSLELQNDQANQKGWTLYDIESYDKQGNILEQGLEK